MKSKDLDLPLLREQRDMLLAFVTDIRLDENEQALCEGLSNLVECLIDEYLDEFPEHADAE